MRSQSKSTPKLANRVAPKPSKTRAIDEDRASGWGLIDSAIVIAIIALFVPRFWLAQQRFFDPDEFEHLHAAWLVSHGNIPYVSFFEHHTPWLYYALVPAFRIFSVDVGSDGAFALLRFVRALSICLSAGGVGLLVWVGKNWLTLRAGLLAALLASATPVFLNKTLEFRPDVPAFLLWLVCLALLIRGLTEPRQSKGGNYALFLCSGLCLGSAIMFTQKMLFTIPGLATSLFVWACFAETGNFRTRFAHGILFCAGLLTPCLMTWAGFASVGAGHAFIEKNFLLNAAWKIRVAPWKRVTQLFMQSWPILLLTAGGLLALLVRGPKAKTKEFWGSAIIGITLVGLIAGLWIIPVAQQQYFLMIVPLTSLLGASYMLHLLDSLSQRNRTWLLIASLMGLSILPILDIAAQKHFRNDQQLRDLRLVLTNSGQSDMVMDGWRGLGVFRPHAFYYYFLHNEIRAMVPREELETFLTNLETAKVQPKLIILDDNLMQLHERFRTYVKQHYTAIGDTGIVIRKPGT